MVLKDPPSRQTTGLAQNSADAARLWGLGLLAVCLAVTAWLTRGYAFPTWNQGQNILLVLAQLDPSLYTKDASVQSFMVATPRYVYQASMAEVSRLFGIGVDSTHFLVNIGAHLSFFTASVVLATGILARIRDENAPLTQLELILCALLGLCCSVSLMSWGSTLFDGNASPSGFATAIAIWAPAMAIRGRWRLAFAIAGLAIPVQFIVGLFAGLVLVPGLAVHARRSGQWRRAAVAIAMWITPALIIYSIMLAHRQEVPASFDFVEVFGHFRHPHHWLPSTGSTAEWLSDLLLVLSALLSLGFLWRATPGARDILLIPAGMIVVALGGVALNYVFVEIIPITLVGKLQFQRIMPFGHLGAYLLLISMLYASFGLRSASPIPVWATGLAVALALPSLLLRQLSLSGANLVILTGLSALLVVLALSRKTTVQAVITAGFVGLFACVNSNLVNSLPGQIAQKLQNRFSPFETVLPPEQDIAGWLRAHTPKDTIVMIPPDWHYFSDFLALTSRRNVYFSLKNVPFTDFDIYKWSQRGEELLGAPMTRALGRPQMQTLWQQQAPEKITAIAEANGICYLVDRTANRPRFSNTALVSQEIYGASWSLWAFDHCADQS